MLGRLVHVECPAMSDVWRKQVGFWPGFQIVLGLAGSGPEPAMANLTAWGRTNLTLLVERTVIFEPTFDTCGPIPCSENGELRGYPGHSEAVCLPAGG